MMREYNPDKVIKNGHDWCSRWYVEIAESDCGAFYGLDIPYITRVYVYPYNESDTIRCLKKVWNHYNKLAFQQMKECNFCINVEARAYIESEDGELHDLSQYWCYEQIEHEEELGISPLPFL